MSDQPQEVKSPAEEETEARSVLQFEYIKSNLFRVAHVDGALGGPTPRGRLMVSFFSERLPIPRQQLFEISSEGQIVKEIEAARIVREGVVRELEVALIMDLPTARLVHTWLGQTIERIASMPRATAKESTPQGDEEPNG